MRIALVAPLVSTIAQPYVGGAQALLADLAVGLTRRGHRVTLFAREGSSVPGVEIESIAVPEQVRPADFSVPFQERSADAGFFAQANLFLDLFLQLQRRRGEFDLIHAHAFDWPAFTCSALVRDLPVLHTLHLPAITPEINAALRAFHQQGHPLTLITVSAACARTYEAFTPIDHIIYNGLDLAAIPFAATADSEGPLLFAGRIAPEKGVEAAIEIAQKAGRRLIIVGGIYDRAYYEQRVAPRIQRSEGRISYRGLLDRHEVWELMGSVPGLLFPSEWDEPFGLVAAEAQATGTPVIAFRRGATAEIIQHGKTGYLVEPGDTTRAAAHVNNLPTLSRTQCRAHIEAHFSLDTMIETYERMYADLLRH